MPCAGGHLAGVLAVSTFRAQQREDAARQAHTAELAARTLDAEFKRVQGLGQQLSETQWVKRRGAAAGLYDEEFGLREKLAICGDLRGYTAGQRRDPAIVCGLSRKGGGVFLRRLL